MTSDVSRKAPVVESDLFDCTMCGDCCRGFGGTIVTEQDIERIAAYIGVDPGSFADRYCATSGSQRVLAQGEDGCCVFFDKLCTIHPVKPRMCRAWPFIRPVLVDVVNWHSMAASCPGMRTDLPDDVITACVERVLEGREEG